MEFDEKLKNYQEIVNGYLNRVLPVDNNYLAAILDSMKYSLLAGGKRLRPVLALGTAEIFGHSIDDVLPYAAGIELIHTYSLIHDDLPAMDNDDFRRGKPTNHKVYGEGMAILAGDGLLNMSFEIMLDFTLKKKELKYIQAMSEIAGASGIYGMIGGQAVDLVNSGKTPSKDVMEYMHTHKTGALIKAPVRAAAIISEASQDEIDNLTGYSESLGLAFQIIDDILDVVGDTEKLGKNTGLDASNNKATYVSMYGLDKAQEAAKALTEDALLSIAYFGERASFLYNLTKYLLGRDY